MHSASRATMRRARRSDVSDIVAMLADDPLGRGRECIEVPLPPSYFQAFERIEADGNIQLRKPATAAWSAACSSASCRD
jgi:hypothetical protein